MLFIGVLFQEPIANLELCARDEQGPTVFGNKLLRFMYVPKSFAMTGDWGNLRNGELHNWCS